MYGWCQWGGVREAHATSARGTRGAALVAAGECWWAAPEEDGPTLPAQSAGARAKCRLLATYRCMAHLALFYPLPESPDPAVILWEACLSVPWDWVPVVRQGAQRGADRARRPHGRPKHATATTAARLALARSWLGHG
ncbi:hypothetical protein ColTof3_06767 [Colletotrichum tofieldiae]|nr:hypothetical protein ColTof3_06767 [Colletotrichum tofieldiae]